MAGVPDRVRAAASSWLVFGGLGLICYGIFYWWKGFPFPLAVLGAFTAFGSLLLGGGSFLRRPATATTLSVSAGTFTLSGALILVVLQLPPWSPWIAIVGLCCAGTVESLRRLRQLRAGSDRTGA